MFYKIVQEYADLYLKDYLFADGTRKYSYHWQDAKGQLRMRWDNSPHHKHITTYPHHKHETAGVTSSHEKNLQDVLEIIRQNLSL